MTDPMPPLEPEAEMNLSPTTDLNPGQATPQAAGGTGQDPETLPARPADGIPQSPPVVAPDAPDEGKTSGTAGIVLEGRSESELAEALRRSQLLAQFEALLQSGCSPGDAAQQVGVSRATLWRWQKRFQEGGEAGLLSDRHRCGRRSGLDLTEAEVQALQQLYLRTNRTEDAGCMRTAAKFFALDPGTREEIRGPILAALELGRLPGPIKRALERVTAAHINARRRPKLSGAIDFSGRVGAFLADKIARRRVIESDDGTLNFACWIPWPMGGDPCSDKFQVRIGRWQFLPAIEAGWSHFYVGYALVCRPRGSYREEDVRALIHLVARTHGLPDRFRFERGSWESNAVVDLLSKLGVELNTVYQPNQKPFVESGFNKLWDYLAVIPGQMGRYRGEMEAENRLLQKCKAGRADPRDHFPSLSQAIQALDGAMAMRNSDVIESIYGRWVPELRFREHKAGTPWKPLPASMEFLFAPYVREWTVTKGSVGGKLPLLDDYSVPFYFQHEDLFRWNGHRVRLYFDPAAEQCAATIVSLGDYHGFRNGEVICRAELVDGLPHYARASLGWSDEEATRSTGALKLARAACRREVRGLVEGGQVRNSTSEARDGGGAVVRIERGQETRIASSEMASQKPSRFLAPPSADAWAKRRARLAAEAEAANALRAEGDSENQNGGMNEHVGDAGD